MSVEKIADVGHLTIFDKSSCLVISKDKPFRLVAKDTRTLGSGLYRLTQLAQNLDSPQIHPLDNSQNRQSIAPSLLTNSATQLSQLWHCRLGHINFASLNLLHSQNLATGIPSFQIIPQVCTACHEGFCKPCNTRKSTPLALIHIDICGPLPVPSLAKTEYFILFTDDFSRKSWIYFLKTKDQALDKFKIFKHMIENQTGYRILILCSDRGGEFLSEAFSQYLQEQGITRQLTTAHTPSQNGVSERKNRTILNMVRAMLIGRHVPKFLWTKVAHTALQLLNDLLTKSNNGTTPDERFSGNKLDLNNHRVFDCLSFVHLNKTRQEKLTSRSSLGTYLRIDDTAKAYHVYSPTL